MANEYLLLADAAGLPTGDRSQVDVEIKDQPRLSSKPVEIVPHCLALIATQNFLPFAQLTAQTFLTHHPGFKAFLLLVDGEPGDAAAFPEGKTVLLDDLDFHDAGWYAAKFTASEFANALKPVFLRYLGHFAQKTIYLDCDIAVFSPLTEMVSL